jgi:DNA-binding MarR family transcriptional regulator
MNIEITKKFLLACHEAKRITERMPKLPKKMKPRHIHVLETIHFLQQNQAEVRISDVGKHLDVTNPSVTKLVNELLALGLVKKEQHPDDKRIFILKLQTEGEKIYQLYGFKFHHWLNDRLTDLNPSDIETAIQIIHRFASELEYVKTDFKENI